LWKIKKQIIICLTCKKKFIQKDSNSKFCSVSCYRVFQKTDQYTSGVKKQEINKFCLFCGNVFTAQKNSKQSFCCRACYLADHSKNMKTDFCKICGSEFYKNKDRIFCSNECYLIFHSKEIKFINCEICKNPFEVPANQKSTNKTCSKKCARKLINKSEIRKVKISKTLKAQYNSGQRKSWNKNKTKENNIVIRKMAKNKKDDYSTGKIIAWNKGIPKTEEEKQIHSIIATRLYTEGKMKRCGHGKSGLYFSKKNKKEVHYRSSYELTAYQILEQLSKVKLYEVEPFSIQYEWKTSIHRTIPDILVTYTDGSKELIEVKPEFKLNFEREALKIDAMRQYAIKNNMDFNVWTEKELGYERN